MRTHPAELFPLIHLADCKITLCGADASWADIPEDSMLLLKNVPPWKANTSYPAAGVEFLLIPATGMSPEQANEYEWGIMDAASFESFRAFAKEDGTLVNRKPS